MNQIFNVIDVNEIYNALDNFVDMIQIGKKYFSRFFLLAKEN